MLKHLVLDAKQLHTMIMFTLMRVRCCETYDDETARSTADIFVSPQTQLKFKPINEICGLRFIIFVVEPYISVHYSFEKSVASDKQRID